MAPVSRRAFTSALQGSLSPRGFSRASPVQDRQTVSPKKTREVEDGGTRLQRLRRKAERCIRERQDKFTQFVALQKKQWSVCITMGKRMPRMMLDIWLFWVVAVPLATLISLLRTGEFGWEAMIGQVHKILPEYTSKYKVARKTLKSYYDKIKEMFVPDKVLPCVLALEKLAWTPYNLATAWATRLYHTAMYMVSIVKAKFGLMKGHVQSLSTDKPKLQQLKVEEKNLRKAWEVAILKRDVTEAIETKHRLMNFTLSHRATFKALLCFQSIPEDLKKQVEIGDIERLSRKHKEMIDSQLGGS